MRILPCGNLLAGLFLLNGKEKIMIHSQLDIEGNRRIFVNMIEVGVERCGSIEAAGKLREIEEDFIGEVSSIRKEILDIMAGRNEEALAFQNQYFSQGVLVVHVMFLSVRAKEIMDKVNSKSKTIKANYTKCNRSIAFTMDVRKVKNELHKARVI